MQQGRELVSASFVIPYPPGFPVLVPGQVINHEIIDFLLALDVKEIHGYRPELGLRIFSDAALGRQRTVTALGGMPMQRAPEPEVQSSRPKVKKAAAKKSALTKPRANAAKEARAVKTSNKNVGPSRTAKTKK